MTTRFLEDARCVPNEDVQRIRDDVKKLLSDALTGNDGEGGKGDGRFGDLGSTGQSVTVNGQQIHTNTEKDSKQSQQTHTTTNALLQTIPSSNTIDSPHHQFHTPTFHPRANRAKQTNEPIRDKTHDDITHLSNRQKNPTVHKEDDPTNTDVRKFLARKPADMTVYSTTSQVSQPGKHPERCGGRGEFCGCEDCWQTWTRKELLTPSITNPVRLRLVTLLNDRPDTPATLHMEQCIQAQQIPWSQVYSVIDVAQGKVGIAACQFDNCRNTVCTALYHTLNKHSTPNIPTPIRWGLESTWNLWSLFLSSPPKTAELSQTQLPQTPTDRSQDLRKLQTAFWQLLENKEFLIPILQVWFSNETRRT